MPKREFIEAFTMPIVSLSHHQDKTQKFNACATYIITLGLMFLAGYLCWTCNVDSSILIKVIYTMLAVIFNGFYLVYYLIYRIILGHSCVSTA